SRLVVSVDASRRTPSFLCCTTRRATYNSRRFRGEITMKRSTSRILTTHAGRLDGPPDLMQTTREIMGGRRFDPQELESKMRDGISHVIQKQADAGIDVVSDGEVTKFGFGSIAYYGRRLSGLGKRPLKAGEAPYMAMQTNERLEFAEFYASME